MPYSSLAIMMVLINTPVSTFELLDAVHLVPETKGVYFIAGPLPDPFAERLRPSQSVLDPDLLYIGAARDLRVRIASHIKNASSGSSFRMTLGAVLREELGLSIHRHLGKLSFDFGQTEARLTDWLSENTRFRFWPVDEPFTVERALITHSSGALNIDGRKDRGAVALLMDLRQQAIDTDTDYERLLQNYNRAYPQVGLTRS